MKIFYFGKQKLGHSNSGQQICGHSIGIYSVKKSVVQTIAVPKKWAKNVGQKIPNNNCFQTK
jgi:hypothetical protein